MKNEMNEIPTPETKALRDLYENHEHRATVGDIWDLCESLERHLTIEKNRAEEMGRLAHANACEATEYRRLLTIALDALTAIADSSANLEHAERMADRALKQTAPK